VRPTRPPEVWVGDTPTPPAKGCALCTPPAIRLHFSVCQLGVDCLSETGYCGVKMAGEFQVIESGIFDDVIVENGVPREFVPASLDLDRGMFDKYVVFTIRGDGGSYPTAMKLEPPDAYEKPGIQPGGVVTVPQNGMATIVNRVTLRNPIPGVYRFIVYVADAVIGTVEIEL
jgi:hypothetical protein